MGGAGHGVVAVAVVAAVVVAAGRGAGRRLRVIELVVNGFLFHLQ